MGQLMAKVKFTNNSNIRLGFEIECVIDMPTLPAWHAGVDVLYQRNRKRYLTFHKEICSLHSKMLIGRDGSINVRGFCVHAMTAEIKTPPLKPKDSMELLQKVFDIVNKYGGTNSSCGFHINISSKSKSEMLRFNPINFSSSKIWNQILSTFNRRYNKYCRNPKYSSKVSIVSEMSKIYESLLDKYRCVNLSNFGSGISKRSRIEIRGIGNKDYSKKYEKIAEYVYRIQRLFSLCCKETTLAKISTI